MSGSTRAWRRRFSAARVFGGEQQEEYPGPRPDDEERPSGPSEHVPGSQKGAGPPEPEEHAARER